MSDPYAHLLSLPFQTLNEFIVQSGPVDLGQRFVADPWEAMARTVIGQQVSTTAAQSIWTRVQSVAADDLFNCFLNQPERLEGCGLSRAKLRTLTELLRAGRDGQLDLAWLATQPMAVRLEQLLPYWGIGPWSVEMFSLFHARDPDVWSPGDLALKKGAAGFAGDAGADALIEAARPYRSYLALYCWRAANAKLFG